MVLRAAVNGTYRGATFDPVDLCRSQHVFQCAEAMEEHRDELNDKDKAENGDKRHTNRV
jgi:hypothetical protein